MRQDCRVARGRLGRLHPGHAAPLPQAVRPGNHDAGSRLQPQRLAPAVEDQAELRQLGPRLDGDSDGQVGIQGHSRRGLSAFTSHFFCIFNVVHGFLFYVGLRYPGYWRFGVAVGPTLLGGLYPPRCIFLCVRYQRIHGDSFNQFSYMVVHSNIDYLLACFAHRLPRYAELYVVRFAPIVGPQLSLIVQFRLTD
jgi:hypothetical protein